MPLPDEPRVEAHQWAVSESPDVAPEPGWVLIVDDDRAFATELAECVSGFGLVAWIESDPEVALDALLGDGRYQVLICDHHMPALVGLDLIRTVKAVHPRPPACLLVTGHASFELAQQALRCEADDFITKPLDPGELEYVLARLITRAKD